MRKWMRERMKRRSTKKAPNETESTGKVGQELPQLDPSQPAPLQPAYYDETSKAGGADLPEGHDPLAVEPGDVVDQAAVEPLSQPYEPSARGYRAGRNQSDALREAVREARGEESHPREQTSSGSEHGRLEMQVQPESPTMPPGPEHAAKGQRAPRGVVVLAIGLPGSGKTTWFKRRGVTPLSKIGR